jgi:hypothetical protein
VTEIKWDMSTLVCGVIVGLFGGNISTIKTQSLINFSKEVGLEVITEKGKYMLMSLSPKCRAKSKQKDS